MTSALIGRGPLLLDFDGPICSIFAGYPAPEVARHLVGILQAKGAVLPEGITGETDPLEVLRWTGANCAAGLVITVEDELCAAELRAASTAAPTPFGHEVIRTASHAGVPIVIVSNNSAGAIDAYLNAHGLRSHVRGVVGRPHGQPSRMKPHPEPIWHAAAIVGAEVGQCVLVGDSLSDIESAHAAGARVIGYANRPTKISSFASADIVITSMSELLPVGGE